MGVHARYQALWTEEGQLNGKNGSTRGMHEVIDIAPMHAVLLAYASSVCTSSDQ
jgi:hypothetical protein